MEEKHEQDFPFWCPNCSKRTATWGAMGDHQLVCGKTNGEIEATYFKMKPFVCGACGKAFDMAYKLDSHSEICGKSPKELQVAYENAYPFACSKCGKAFDAAYKLDCHEGAHQSIAALVAETG